MVSEVPHCKDTSCGFTVFLSYSIDFPCDKAPQHLTVAAPCFSSMLPLTTAAAIVIIIITTGCADFSIATLTRLKLSPMAAPACIISSSTLACFSALAGTVLWLIPLTATAWYLWWLFIYCYIGCTAQSPEETPGSRVGQLHAFTSDKMNYPAISVHSLRNEKARCKQNTWGRNAALTACKRSQKNTGGWRPPCRPAVCATVWVSAPAGPGFSLNHKAASIPNYPENEKAQMRCLWWDSLHWTEPEAARSFPRGWRRESLWGKDKETGVTGGRSCSTGCWGSSSSSWKMSSAAASVIEMRRRAMEQSWGWPLHLPAHGQSQGVGPWCCHRDNPVLSATCGQELCQLRENKTSPAKYIETVLEQLESAFCSPGAPLKSLVSTLWWSGYQNYGQIALLLVGDV